MSLTFEQIQELFNKGFTPEQITALTHTKMAKAKKEKKQSEGKTDGMHYVEPFRMDRNNNEVEKVYKAMKNDRDKLYVIVSVYMAYRVSDIRLLTFGQLRDEFVKVTEKKTKNERTIEVHKRIKKELEKFNDRPDHEYAFQSRQGSNQPMSRQQAHNIISDASEKIGLIKRTKPVGNQRKGNIVSLKRYGTHSLRKAFGYSLWKNGENITTIMEMYGHSSPKITRAYLGIDQEAKNEVSRRLDFGF